MRASEYLLRLDRCMNSIDPFESDFSKLASNNPGKPDFESFCSGVWRKIRHRQAIDCISTAEPFCLWGLLDFSSARLAWTAACLAACVGVTSGIWAAPDMKNSRVAARNLDLEVFSYSASGLPSQFWALGK